MAAGATAPISLTGPHTPVASTVCTGTADRAGAPRTNLSFFPERDDALTADTAASVAQASSTLHASYLTSVRRLRADSDVVAAQMRQDGAVAGDKSNDGFDTTPNEGELDDATASTRCAWAREGWRQAIFSPTRVG